MVGLQAAMQEEETLERRGPCRIRGLLLPEQRLAPLILEKAQLRSRASRGAPGSLSADRMPLERAHWQAKSTVGAKAMPEGFRQWSSLVASNISVKQLATTAMAMGSRICLLRS